MKAIKIIEANAEAVEKALKMQNGRATAHAYTSFSEIAELAEQAEAGLAKLLYKKDFAGARLTATSGGSVAKSYRDARKVTVVTIERKSGAWYLIGVCASSIYDSAKPARLYLTAAQDTAAKAKLAEKYSVIR